MNNQRYLILSKHPLASIGIDTILSIGAGVDYVRDVNNREETIRMCNELNPGLLLMDWQIIEETSFTWVIGLHEQFPKLPILLFSTEKKDVHFEKSMEAYISGFILEEEMPGRMVEAVKTILHGEKWFSQETKLNPDRNEDITIDRNNQLTLRELEIMRLMSEGKTDKEICHELGVTKNTVRSHIKRIFAKLQCANRTEAVYIAQREHIL